MATWPASVPFEFDVNGFSHAAAPNSSTIDPEVGEPMTRRRFTGEVDSFSGQLPPLTREQANDLRNFYRYDLKDGSLRFTQDDPMTGTAREFMFAESPSFSAISGKLWQADVRLVAIS